MRLDFFLFTLFVHLPSIERTSALLHSSSNCPFLPLLMVLGQTGIRANTHANARANAHVNAHANAHANTHANATTSPSFAVVRNDRDISLVRVKRKPFDASSSSPVGGINKRILSSSPTGLLDSAEEMEEDGTSSQPSTRRRSAFEKRQRTQNSATDWNETGAKDEISKKKKKGRKGFPSSHHPFLSPLKAGVKDDRSPKRTGLVKGKACSKPIRQNFIDIGERLKQIRETATNVRGFAATFKKGLSLVQNFADVAHKCSSNCRHKIRSNPIKSNKIPSAPGESSNVEPWKNNHVASGEPRSRQSPNFLDFEALGGTPLQSSGNAVEATDEEGRPCQRDFRPAAPLPPQMVLPVNDLYVKKTEVEARICPDLYTRQERLGACYRFVAIPMKWADAQEYCLRKKANLVAIDSMEENEFLKSGIMMLNDELQSMPAHISPGHRISWWLGAADQHIEGKWLTVQGEELKAIDWARGEPNNDQDSEHCLTFWTPQRKLHEPVALHWNDYHCEKEAKFICEFRLKL